MEALASSLWPWVLPFVAGYAFSEIVVEKLPEYHKEITAGCWVVGGAAVGTAIAPVIGTAIGAVVGGVIAWWTY
ncbi:hypothetical protein ACFL3H_01040 [Gemmatimonadota bacterium]